MKLKIGKNPHRYEADLELAAAVRQAVGPDVFLSADANCGMERTAAMQLARGLEKLNFAWFEEPLAPDDLDGYAEMARALDMPIAGGETEFTRFGFREILNRKAMDIIQPNLPAAHRIGQAVGGAVRKRVHAPATRSWSGDRARR
jgi:D-galactarolactone cycloisomerase